MDNWGKWKRGSKGASGGSFKILYVNRDFYDSGYLAIVESEHASEENSRVRES
jgi:hypothetical protein